MTLAEPDQAVADTYGVYILLGDGVAAPAIFSVNKSGQFVWSYLGQSVSHRPSVQTVLENLPRP